MRVAIFTDNDFEKVNGVTTTFTAALQTAPDELRLRVYTAASVPVEAPDYLAVRSPSMPIPFYRDMRMYAPRCLELLRRARGDRIDLIHLTTPGPIGLAALFVAWRMQVPLVGSFHTDLAAYAARLSGAEWLGRLMREYMRWPYGRCTRVLVPSEHTRRLLVEARMHPDRVAVWPRGVDTTLFAPERRRQALRDAWHVSDRRPALIYVGRVSREKGLLMLPALRDRLHARGVEHRLVVVGDGPLLPELRERLPDAHFTGTLSREKVAEALAAAELFVFPSQTDTAGNVVLEAQASGLPVIVSGTGGPRENMVEGRTGVICESERPDEWADAVVGVLRDRNGLRAMAAAAREYALSRTWARAMRPLHQAYREVYATARAGEVLPVAHGV